MRNLRFTSIPGSAAHSAQVMTPGGAGNPGIIWKPEQSAWDAVKGSVNVKRERHVTTINLDEETKAIARTLPNLSWFVRDALRNHRDTTDRTVLQEHPRYDITLGCCSPFNSQGICGLCWPQGAPTRKDWLESSRMARAGTTVQGERISHTDRWPGPTIYEDRGQYLPGGKPIRKPGILRRAVNWLW